MAIDIVHLNGAMTGVNDYLTGKHFEEGRVLSNQVAYQGEVEKNTEKKLNQVQEKDDLGNRQRKFDAKDKGDNSYAGDGGQNRNNGRKDPDGTVRPITRASFDLKI